MTIVRLGYAQASRAVDAAIAQAEKFNRPRAAPPQPLSACHEHRVQSTLDGPWAQFGGKELYPSLPEKAAVIAYGFAKNHCCPDGNKRLGLILLSVFLAMNGYVLAVSQEDAAETILTIAESEAGSRDEQLAVLSAWITTNMQPLREGRRG